MDASSNARQPGPGDYRPPPIPVHGIPRPFKTIDIREQKLGGTALLEIRATCMDGPINGWRGPPQFSLISIPGRCEDRAPLLRVEGRLAVLIIHEDSPCRGIASPDTYFTAKMPLGRAVNTLGARLMLVAESETHVPWLVPYLGSGGDLRIEPIPGKAAALLADAATYSDHVAAGTMEYLEEVARRAEGRVDPLLIVDVRAKCGLGLCGSCLMGDTGLLACVEGPGIRVSALRGREP